MYKCISNKLPNNQKHGIEIEIEMQPDYDSIFSYKYYVFGVRLACFYFRDYNNKYCLHITFYLCDCNNSVIDKFDITTDYIVHQVLSRCNWGIKEFKFCSMDEFPLICNTCESYCHATDQTWILR